MRSYCIGSVQTYTVIECGWTFPSYQLNMSTYHSVEMMDGEAPSFLTLTTDDGKRDNCRNAGYLMRLDIPKLSAEYVYVSQCWEMVDGEAPSFLTLTTDDGKRDNCRNAGYLLYFEVFHTLYSCS